MTAVTVHRPTSAPARGRIPAQRPRLTVVPEPTSAPGRPSMVVPLPERPIARPVGARAIERPAGALDTAPARVAGGAVQLTRRGRLVLLVTLVAAGIALMLAVAGLTGGAAAGTTPSQPASRTIVVQPGQTLWSIARDIAPNADRRDTIARIVELNALPSSAVSAGERIAVPTR